MVAIDEVMMQIDEQTDRRLAWYKLLRLGLYAIWAGLVAGLAIYGALVILTRLIEQY